MKVQVWSDIMCPFCYLAKKNFEKAMENVPFGHEIDVEWKSYQLDPQITDTSGNLLMPTYLKEKKGMSAAQADSLLQQLNIMAKDSGIVFNSEVTKIVDTIPAHKLIQLAKKHEISPQVEEMLFEAHFRYGQNIADHNVLTDIGTLLGLKKDEILKALTDDSYDYTVKQDILEARSLQIAGVPYFVFDDKYAVSGAQSSDVFVQALTMAKQEENKSPDLISGAGGSCGTNGCEF